MVRSPLRAARATWALNAAEWLFRLPAIGSPFLGLRCSLTGGPVFGVHYKQAGKTPPTTLPPPSAGWVRVRFGDVIRDVMVRVDPETSGLKRYIAGEHLASNDMRV